MISLTAQHLYAFYQQKLSETALLGLASQN